MEENRPTRHEQSRALVSYARRDGEALACGIVDGLRREGLDVWMDRRDLYGGRNWWRQIAGAIGNADYLVSIVTSGALDSEVVEREWRLARTNGVCVLPVRGGPELDFTALPRWMSVMHFYTLDEEWETLVRDVRGGCEPVRVPFMAADLPRGYVERRQELEAAKRLLLVDGHGDSLAVYRGGGFARVREDYVGARSLP